MTDYYILKTTFKPGDIIFSNLATEVSANAVFSVKFYALNEYVFVRLNYNVILILLLLAIITFLVS